MAGGARPAERVRTIPLACDERFHPTPEPGERERLADLLVLGQEPPPERLAPRAGWPE